MVSGHQSGQRERCLRPRVELFVPENHLSLALKGVMFIFTTLYPPFPGRREGKALGWGKEAGASNRGMQLEPKWHRDHK